MRFFLDNNLPPKLAKALNCLAEPEAQVIHLREKFEHSIKDHEWINQLASGKDWVIISCDGFSKTLHEKEALRKSGLIAFILKSGWGNLQFWDMAHQLVRWWPRIMEQAEGISGGAVFEVPVKFSGKGRFEQVKL